MLFMAFSLPWDLFPAHAGMTRRQNRWYSPDGSVPRTRGDDPEALEPAGLAQSLFPAHAGMAPLKRIPLAS